MSIQFPAVEECGFDRQFLTHDYLVISSHYDMKKVLLDSKITPLSCYVKIKSLDSIYNALPHVKVAISFFLRYPVYILSVLNKLVE